MANVTLSTRVRSKYDTLENWQTVASTFVPLSGEICITSVPTGSSLEQVTPPAILFKVGDGSTAWGDLPWGSALAADVYSWAKAATKPTYTASEVGAASSDDLTNAIAALDVTDTAVDGEYVSSVSQTDGKISVTKESLPTYTFTTGTTKGAFTVTPSNGTAESVSIYGLGTAAYTASTAYATASQGSLADSALQPEDITTGTSNGTISVDGTAVSVYGLGTAAYTSSSAYDEAGAADTAVSTHNSSTTAHSDIRTLISNLQTEVSSIEAVTGSLTNAMQFIGESTTDPSTGTATVDGETSFAAGSVVVYGNKEYVLGTNGSWIELGDEGDHLSSTTAEATYVKQTTTVNGKALSSNITLTASDVDAATADDITSAIEALDVTDTAVSGQYVSSVSQTDGKITVTRGTLATYSNATTSAAGLMSASDKSKLDGIEEGANNYELSAATTTELGGIVVAGTRDTAPTKTVGGTTASRYYGVETDSAGVAFVNVPWSNTTYSEATTSTAGLMSADDKTKLDGIEEGGEANIIEVITVNGTALTISDKTAALGAAAGYAVTTSISANTTSTALPTAAAVETRINAHSGIDTVGTVTSVAVGTGLTISGTASVSPTISLDDSVVFILDGGSSTTNV